MTRYVLYLCGLMWLCCSTAQATILWSAGMESGNLNEWDGEWNSSGGGTADSVASTAQHHTGSWSCASTTNGDAGTRMAKDQIDNTTLPDAYYSAWLYFPQLFTVPDWWNVMQWKRTTYPYGSGSDPPYTIDALRRSTNLYFSLYNHVGTNGVNNGPGSGITASAPVGVNIPIGQWVHLECLYIWRTTLTGRIQCWQDGVQLWDKQNVITEYNYLPVDDIRIHQWTVNNYTSGITPAPATIYIDDAAISTTQLSGGDPNPPGAPTNLRVNMP